MEKQFAMENYYNPDTHHRRSIRLKGYDYSRAGAYFLTICVYNRETLFGDILDGRMELNPYGRVVHDEWLRSYGIRREIELGPFVIMPNHIHGIIRIVDACRGDRWSPCQCSSIGRPPVAPTPGPQSKSIGAFIAGFKSATSRQINAIRKTPGALVWQRNYYEHIIRDESDYNTIAEYIATNPQRWREDQLHPGNTFVHGRPQEGRPPVAPTSANQGAPDDLQRVW